MENKDKNKVEKVEWLGLDGLLVGLYVVLAVIYAFGIIKRIDFIIGIMAPVTAIAITVFVFLRYCFEVFVFTKKAAKK